MKKKSTSQSAFFNLRVLAALLVCMTGVSLALFAANPLGRNAGLTAASAAKSAKLQQKYNIMTRSSIDPLVPAMFDCSKIKQLGIDRQENFRAGAIMIFCGLSKPGGAPSHFGLVSTKLIQNLTAPVVYGATDVNLITGTETSPNVTQSETYTAANPDDPTEVVVAYNDSRGRNLGTINISGASVSTDGGTTFTRVTNASGQSPFANTLGDPVALYNKPSGTWFTIWLDVACGGQGLGGYKSTDPSDPNSWTHFCVHTNSQDDRESGWADNDPSSPFFGRMYVSWNDFNVGGGALFVTFSTDNGATWHAPVTVSNTGIFIRDVQITGDLAGNGNVYIAGMDEGGGGFPHDDTNKIFKSTDGGNTWTNTYTGTPFPGPGVTSVGYFACMFPDLGGYWRHEGWGQPAAFNNTVHLVYAQHGTGSDPGDVYYIRSTDGGVTFGAPLKLNTDATTRPQWQPNLSVSPTGTLFATWYDARESASCTVGNTGVPCYRMWSRKSNDNGASWLPDDMLSDVVTPLPAQPDPGIQPTYAGDYDYGSAIAAKHVTSWADGRVAISGASQQDAFTDRDLVGFSVTTADPACGSLITAPAPTDFVVDLSDPADPATVDASDFTVNGTAADSASLSNGNATITFTFDTSPVVEGENTMHIAAGAILQASNNDPILEFNCTFRFAATLLEVTDTDPPVGGTFTGPGTATYDVNFNEEVDPASVQTSDLTLSGVSGSTVTAVTVLPGNTTAEFTLNFTSIFSGTLTASIAEGAITDQFGNPNSEFSGDYNYTGNFCPTLSENFDSVTPPALPPDWVATNVIDPDGIFWQSSDSGDPQPPADSLPNAVWVNDAGTRADKRLDSLSFTYGAGAQLAFTQNYDLEQLDATTAFDNGLLEISFDNGATFQEFVAAGGSFVSGGYDHTAISDGFENPCFQQYGTGQANWSGISNGGAGGFQTTTAVLPAAGVGNQVKLRWRECSDSSVSHTGWRVDNVGIFESCGTPTPTPTVTPSVTPTVTPSVTPTVTPSATPTATPTATPRVTPRPRPTPYPRPTP